MKKIILLLADYLCIVVVPAQHQLHIHHINIENGDATLIGIHDETYTINVRSIKAEIRRLILKLLNWVTKNIFLNCK